MRQVFREHQKLLGGRRKFAFSRVLESTFQKIVDELYDRLGVCLTREARAGREGLGGQRAQD